MAAPAPIDLLHQASSRVIGSYLLDTPDGLALFDCGPASTLANLKRGLRTRGVELADVRHVLLSHIHLDHAGAAGVIVREHPHITVHVSAVGARHVIDPTRLEASARRLYGASFEGLWGELAAVPEDNVRVVGDNALDLVVFATPGHASHHVCYLAGDGTLYAGDACGVRITPATVVMPPTPPPDIDVEAWDATLDEILVRRPERLALVHFGVFDDVQRHLDDLRARLHLWRDVVAGGANETEFIAYARAEIADDTYDRAMPLWQSYAGLKRYVERVMPSRSQATDAA